MNPRESFYIKAKNAILALGQQNLAMTDLIKALNHIILKEKISDKPITYTENEPYIASWNMGCGTYWVDTTKPEGALTERLNNPVLKNPAANKERLDCCALILHLLQHSQKKLFAIALQEAPPPLDSFYELPGAKTIQLNPSVKSATNEIGFIGMHNVNDNKLWTSLHTLTKKYHITEKEYQFGKLSDDRLFIQVHLEYAITDEEQKNRAAFLKELRLLDQNIVILGDTNIKRKNLYMPKENFGGETFGIRGTEPVDLIWSAHTKPTHHAASSRDKPFAV